MSSRAALAVVLAIFTVAGYFWLSADVAPPGAGPGAGGAAPPRAGRPLALTSSAECRACHAEVYDEWRASQHGRAFVNPEVQSLTKNFRDRDCLPCHAPQPVFETGVTNRVLERQVRLEEGVDCFACHKHHDALLGGAHVPADSPAPCNPRPYPAVGDVSACAPCHDQHKVVSDWRLTRYAAPGAGFKDCNACHLPPAPRAAAAGRPAYVGKSHRFPGAHDVAFLKTAATMKADFAPDGALEFEILNDGTGHHFPADERHRSVDVVVAVEGESGVLSTALLDRYRNPYRDEFHLKNPLREPGATRTYALDLGAAGAADVRAARIADAFNPGRRPFHPENTQIPAGEARRYRVQFPRGVRKAAVRVYYKLKPPATYDEAALLFERVFEAVGPGPGVFGVDGFETAPPPLAGAAPPSGDALPAPLPVVVRAAAFLDASEDPAARAARILALGTTADDVALLRYLLKDRSQSAFVVLDDPAAPDGFRVEENPFGGEFDRSLDRIAAIRALEAGDAMRALPELLLAVDDRDRLVAAHAGRALARLGVRSGTDALLAELDGKAYATEHVERFLRELSGEDFGFDPDVGATKKAAAAGRWRAWWRDFSATGKRLRGEGPGYRRGVDADVDRRLAKYADLLGGFQFLYMEQSRKALRRLGAPAVDILREAALRATGDAGATGRGGMAQVLGGIPGEAAGALLTTMLADPHPTVRARAVESFAERGGADAPAAVRGALADRDPSVVVAALRALGRVGSVAQDLGALDAAGASADTERRAAALTSAFLLSRDGKRFDRVAGLLFDPSVVARTAALEALNGALGRAAVADPDAPEAERRAALEVWRTAVR